jgi:hypothetical protein
MSRGPKTDRTGPLGWLGLAFVLYSRMLLVTQFIYALEGDRSLGEALDSF